MMMIATPTAMTANPVTGTHRGLGLGFAGLGGMYVDRFDFDRGTSRSSRLPAEWMGPDGTVRR